MKDPVAFETSLTVHHLKRHKAPEDQNLRACCCLSFPFRVKQFPAIEGSSAQGLILSSTSEIRLC